MGRFIAGVANAPGLGGKGFFGPVAVTSIPEVWTSRAPPHALEIVLCACAGGGVSLAGDSTPRWSNSFGQTWHGSNTINVVNASPCCGGFYQNGTWLLSYGNATHAGVAHSTDGGKNFTLTTLAAVGSPQVSVICGDGGATLVAGLAGTLSGGNYFTSIDNGANWVQQNSFSASSWGNTVTGNTMVWDSVDNQFVALANLPSSNTALVSSVDGVNWTVERDFGTGFNGSLGFADNTGAVTYYLSFGTTHVAAGFDTIADLLTGSFGYDSGGIDTGMSGFVTCLIAASGASNARNCFAFSSQGEAAVTPNSQDWLVQDLKFAPGDVCQTVIQDTVNQELLAFAGPLSTGPADSFSTRPASVSA